MDTLQKSTKNWVSRWLRNPISRGPAQGSKNPHFKKDICASMLNATIFTIGKIGKQWDEMRWLYIKTQGGVLLQARNHTIWGSFCWMKSVNQKQRNRWCRMISHTWDTEKHSKRTASGQKWQNFRTNLWNGVYWGSEMWGAEVGEWKESPETMVDRHRHPCGWLLKWSMC